MPQPSRFSPIRNEIAGVPVGELAQKFGTPTFVYDAAKIVERLNDLKSFDVIRYAQKACSNLAILDLVRRQGAFVDCVSAGEIHRALTAGFSRTAAAMPIPLRRWCTPPTSSTKLRSKWSLSTAFMPIAARPT